MSKVITFNGYDNDSVSYIALTDIPNIITVKDGEDNFAQYAQLSISCSTTSIANKEDGRFVIGLFGETIASVKNYKNAINNNFWISPDNNISTAASIARALRNCQSLSANFTVENNGNVVLIKGRRLFETTFQNDLYMYDAMDEYSESDLMNVFFKHSASDGQDPSDLTNAKVQIDIYSGDSYDYVTTLEKTCPESSVSFNVSPAITTLATYGRTDKWAYRVSYTTYYGSYQAINDKEDAVNYVSIGGSYEIPEGRGLNQIDSTTACLAMPIINRLGPNTSFANQFVLYVYDHVIPLSFYKGNNSGGNINVTYRDSAFQVISSITTTWHSYDSTNKLFEMELDVAYDQATMNWFERSFYIDVYAGGQDIRYNVIKPLKAAEDYVRIYFRNPLGGLSFFDFTGKKTVTETIGNTKTYNKSVYDYQENYDDNIDEIVYGKDVTKNITVKSHVVEESAKYTFNDLIKADKAYFYADNQQYDIVIDSVSFDELDNSNNLFEATLKFHYSIKI